MANTTTQPTHRIHSANEPLPVSGEGIYSPDNINRLADQDQDMYPAAQRNNTTTTHCHTHSPSHIPTLASLGTNDANDLGPDRGENRFDIPTRTTDDANRTLGSQGTEYPTETHRGESRFDERPGLSGGDATSNAPYAKPGIKDKIIGKTEELAGKITRDPEMAMKGTIRSEIGKEGMVSREY